MTSRVFWIGALIALSAASALRGQCSNVAWTVTGTNAGSQTVAVHLCGLWVGGCVPHNPQFSVTGDQINISLTAAELPDCQCIVVEDPFEQTVIVSGVPPGTYSVTATVVSCGQPQVVGTGSLVAGAAAAVPGLDSRGVAILALLVAAVGLWKLRA